jgi:hypothetical protein
MLPMNRLDAPSRMMLVDTALAMVQYMQHQQQQKELPSLWEDAFVRHLCSELIWQGWSDLPYVQYRCRSILDGCMKLSTNENHVRQRSAMVKGEKDAGNRKEDRFIVDFCGHALGMAVHEKSRYVLLRSMMEVVGVPVLLELRPELWNECIDALR